MIQEESRMLKIEWNDEKKWQREMICFEKWSCPRGYEVDWNDEGCVSDRLHILGQLLLPSGVSKSQNVIIMLSFDLELLDQSSTWTNRKSFLQIWSCAINSILSKEKNRQVPFKRRQVSILCLLYSFCRLCSIP